MAYSQMEANSTEAEGSEVMNQKGQWRNRSSVYIDLDVARF